MKNLAVPAAAVVCLLPVLASAQGYQPQATGISLGYYTPLKSPVKDVFDNSIKFGVARLQRLGRNNTTTLTEFNILSGSKDGSKYLILPYMAVQEFRFGSGDRSSFVPYARIGAGLAYADYSVNLPGGRESAKRGLFAGNAELGVALSDRLRVGVRYDYFTKAGPLDFSGLEFTVRWAFLSL